MAASPTAVTSPKAMIALEIEILMTVAPWSSPVVRGRGPADLLDNGSSVYGFNISLSIPPYDYLDVDDLAGRVIAGARVANPASAPRDGFWTRAFWIRPTAPCGIRNPV